MIADKLKGEELKIAGELTIKVNVEENTFEIEVECRDLVENEPYLETSSITKEISYNTNFGDDRVCECGHPYYRHFDSYEQMAPVGCKYCECFDFKEETN